MPKTPEEIREYHHAWYLKNRARRKPLEKAYREQNRELIHARIRSWQLKNPERLKAYALIDKARHPDRIAQTKREYRLNNREKLNAIARAYYHTDPERSLHKSKTRRARLKGAKGLTLSSSQWREIQEAFNHCCAYCGRKMKRLTQDHITPLSHGGEHIASNVVPACHSCNARKQAGPPPIPVQPLLLTIAPAKKEKSS